jgi:ribosomal protein L36
MGEVEQVKVVQAEAEAQAPMMCLCMVRCQIVRRGVGTYVGDHAAPRHQQRESPLGHGVAD